MLYGYLTNVQFLKGCELFLVQLLKCGFGTTWWYLVFILCLYMSRTTNKPIKFRVWKKRSITASNRKYQIQQNREYCKKGYMPIIDLFYATIDPYVFKYLHIFLLGLSRFKCSDVQITFPACLLHPASWWGFPDMIVQK